MDIDKLLEEERKSPYYDEWVTYILTLALLEMAEQKEDLTIKEAEIDSWLASLYC